MKKGSGRRKYDKQFKEEAVKLVTEGERQVTEGSFPGKGHLKPQDEEQENWAAF